MLLCVVCYLGHGLGFRAFNLWSVLVYSVLQHLLAITLLRAGPQDLPAHSSLPLWLTAAYVLVGGLMGASDEGFAISAMQAGVDALLLAVFSFGVLKLRDFPQRFNQTYAALVGISLLFTLLSWPLLGALPDALSNQLSLAQIGLLVIVLWNLVALGQVLRSALEVGAGVGLVLAVV